MAGPTQLPLRFFSLDTPLGPLMVMECRHPEANAERPDIPLGRMCREHVRTWYWCLDREEAWCDGGPPDYAYHLGELVASEA
jgi:hypothetical protein